MKKQIGLWIDHKQAVIVALQDGEEETKLVTSGVEKQRRRSGDSPLKGPYESLQVPADDSQLRTFTAQLNSYYDDVIAVIRDAESILIFGPGMAKDELKKRLEGENLDGLIVAIEPADRMTEPQIAAKVRERFLN